MGKFFDFRKSLSPKGGIAYGVRRGLPVPFGMLFAWFFFSWHVIKSGTYVITKLSFY